MIYNIQTVSRILLALSFLFIPHALFADSDKKIETKVLSQGNGPIFVLTIDGTINPVSSDYIQKGLLHASALDGRLVVIKMNTPGGLLPSMQTIVEAILDSKVPVAIYVTPSGGGAISAGVFITLAGHIAVMSPGTTIGAAAPVQSGGADIGEDMKGKVQNFAASMVKSIAEQRGRNVEWAEKAVRESVALTDNEALEQKVIDFIAPNLEVLLQEAENFECHTPNGKIILTELQNHPRESFDMTTQQKIINAISDPNIAALLGLGAMGGILAEFYNPGLIFPGLFGVICLILSLVAMQVIPINAGGILLLLLGGVLMTVEFLIPSFGIFGIAGVVCLVLGSIYAIDTSMVWAVDGFAVDTVMVGSIAGFLGITLLSIVYLAVSSKTRKVTTGKEGLIGMKAKVTREFVNSDTSIYPRGSVRVMGEIWSAELVSGDLPLLVGSEVLINGIDGIVLKVVK
jgi:membrane-bound serine protease (ClpP class)